MKAKKTSLYSSHVDMKGNMVNFGGYLLPTHYSSIKEEHLAVRKSAGLFDVSHMGEILIEGVNSESFLQYITTNRVDTLCYGSAQYSIICNEKGGILDDILIYKMQNSYMLVVNASNKQKILNWLNQHAFKNIKIRDISDETGLIAIQGPKSLEIITDTFKVDMELSYYKFLEKKVNDIDLIISRTGYTGELGFELFMPKNNIKYFWDSLLKKGKNRGLRAAGLGCRDTLRMEMKFSLYGNDLNESINPIEAGLGWLVKFDKGDFIGKNKLKVIKNNSKLKSICIEMVDKAIPRKDYQIFFKGTNIGKVTSGTMSPSLGKGIAIAMVNIKFTKVGYELMVDIRGKQKKAIVIKSPFYKLGTMLDK